jgi:hypothetical protein
MQLKRRREVTQEPNKKCKYFWDTLYSSFLGRRQLLKSTSTQKKESTNIVWNKIIDRKKNSSTILYINVNIHTKDIKYHKLFEIQTQYVNLGTCLHWLVDEFQTWIT